MDKLGMLLTKRMKELGLTQEELAEKVGVTQGSVGHWINQKRSPTLKKMKMLEQILELPTGSLTYAQEPKLSLETPPKNRPQNTVYKHDGKSVIIRAFPLLKSNEVREWMKNPLTSSARKMVNLLIYDKDYGDSPFLFENIGKSMVSREAPEESMFPHEIAIVDPNRAPEDGQLVLAEFGENDMRIRQYREDGAYKFLHAFDPEIKSTSLDDKVKVIGTIVGSHRNR